MNRQKITADQSNVLQMFDRIILFINNNFISALQKGLKQLRYTQVKIVKYCTYLDLKNILGGIIERISRGLTLTEQMMQDSKIKDKTQLIIKDLNQ